MHILDRTSWALRGDGPDHHFRLTPLKLTNCPSQVSFVPVVNLMQQACDRVWYHWKHFQELVHPFIPFRCARRCYKCKLIKPCCWMGLIRTHVSGNWARVNWETDLCRDKSVLNSTEREYIAYSAPHARSAVSVPNGSPLLWMSHMLSGQQRKLSHQWYWRQQRDGNKFWRRSVGFK